MPVSDPIRFGLNCQAEVFDVREDLGDDVDKIPGRTGDGEATDKYASLLAEGYPAFVGLLSNRKWLPCIRFEVTMNTKKQEGNTQVSTTTKKKQDFTGDCEK